MAGSSRDVRACTTPVPPSEAALMRRDSTSSEPLSDSSWPSSPSLGSVPDKLLRRLVEHSARPARLEVRLKAWLTVGSRSLLVPGWPSALEPPWQPLLPPPQSQLGSSHRKGQPEGSS